MKNIKRCLSTTFILVLTLIYAGCHNNVDDVNSQNPFVDIGNENTTIASEYGHSPNNFPEDFTYFYQGGILSIPYKFYGGRVDSEIGLLVFIDGVVQQYYVDNSADAMYEYMNTFNIEANLEETHMLNIIPNCGKSGDILKLNFVCIAFPTLNALDLSSLESQSMSTTISWKLSYLQDASFSGVTPKKAPMLNTTSNNIEDDSEDIDGFDSSLEESDTQESTKKAISFIANAGQTAGYYRATVFIDSWPMMVDGEESFVEYSLNKKEKLTYKCEIDDNNLNGKNVLYAVSIRLDNPIDERNSQIDVYKTNSILLEK